MDRRTVLKGLGAVVGLPFLEAMLPITRLHATRFSVGFSRRILRGKPEFYATDETWFADQDGFDRSAFLGFTTGRDRGKSRRHVGNGEMGNRDAQFLREINGR